MSRHKVALASLGLSLVVTAGLVVVLVLSNGRGRKDSGSAGLESTNPQLAAKSAGEPAPSAQPPGVTPSEPFAGSPAPAPSTQAPADKPAVVASSESAGTTEELPIEELLAGTGEDPGAVYYTSRVREALREGNPLFARELLRQMAQLHPSSVLLDEAAALCAER
jgi:hypothetical protein